MELLDAMDDAIDRIEAAGRRRMEQTRKPSRPWPRLGESRTTGDASGGCANTASSPPLSAEAYPFGCHP